jgi:long-chain acyl-CoA synthetase
MTNQTVPTRFLETVAAHGEVAALRLLHDSDEADAPVWTYRDYAAQVAALAAGLAARGVGRGDRVAIMMRNRPEFHFLDTAVQFLGAIPYSLYVSASAEEVAFVVRHAAARMAVVEDAGLLERFSLARQQESPLADVVVMEGDGGDGVVPWSALTGEGVADLDALAAQTAPEAAVTVIYTSGTTGHPKAAVITHANVCCAADAMLARTAIEEPAGLAMISYLPMAHIAERLVSHYVPLLFGTTVHPLSDVNKFADFARVVKPEIVFGVPRVWEKIQQGVLAAAAADPAKAKALHDGIEAALGLAATARQRPLTKEEQDTWDFLDAVAFSTVRELTGLSRAKLAVTGAAPIHADLVDWYRAMRVPLSETYGMSESTGVLTWDPYEVRPGSAGRALPGVEVRIADDGEVLARGGVVFEGYLDDPQKTAETVVDGWLHTGDIGTLDDDGYLSIVDRKKELIITAGGENVSPANLEAALKSIPLVGEVCVVGDRQKYPAAVITLDVEYARTWAQDRAPGATLADLATDPEVTAEVQRGLDTVNQQFTRSYQVKRFVIVPDEWLPDSDVMTPTFKLKRRGVAARYTKEIAGLYE